MQYQKIVDLLDNTSNQSSKFRTEICVKKNDDSCGTYNTNSQIRFKTSMLKSSPCDYTDAYIAVKGTITVPNTGAAAAPNNKNKELVFKNCALFTDCISEINNTQIDNSKDIDVAMDKYNLIEYSENYLQNIIQPALNDDDNIIGFLVNDDTSLSFKYKKI